MVNGAKCEWNIVGQLRASVEMVCMGSVRDCLEQENIEVTSFLAVIRHIFCAFPHERRMASWLMNFQAAYFE